MTFKFRCLPVPLALVGCVVPTTQAEELLPYSQAKDVVYGEIHGTGLLMDIFTPSATTNGLAIVDVVSGAWSSDRNKIRDHTLEEKNGEARRPPQVVK